MHCSDEEMQNRFTWHPPQTTQRTDDHALVRQWCGNIARAMNHLLPDGREKSLAITKLEEAMFWANAAIARQP